MGGTGYFDRFGGRYVAEVLRAPLEELEAAFGQAMADPAFIAELDGLRRDFIGRPTPLLRAENASRELGGARITSYNVCYTKLLRICPS